MEVTKNEFVMGSSTISEGKCPLEPRHFIPGSRGTKRIANHTALAWKDD